MPVGLVSCYWHLLFIYFFKKALNQTSRHPSISFKSYLLWSIYPPLTFESNATSISFYNYLTFYFTGKYPHDFWVGIWDRKGFLKKRRSSKKGLSSLPHLKIIPERGAEGCAAVCSEWLLVQFALNKLIYTKHFCVISIFCNSIPGKTEKEQVIPSVPRCMHKTTMRVTNRKLHCNALLKSKIETILQGDWLILSAGEENSMLELYCSWSNPTVKSSLLLKLQTVTIVAFVNEYFK